MAKRKRLTPPRNDYLQEPEAGAARPGPVSAPLATGGAAPIARVAGETAAAAALETLAEEMRAAREAGRLVQELPLDAVDPGWLMRDRLHVDAAEMADLVASIRERGQQTPIEVVALDEAGRYGLISGWRRLTALRQVFEETGAARFATVQALLRRPESAGAAYRAMVEENEIRVGLSYYERARVAARAAEAGVFPDAREAVRALFASASRAKRSKITSFLALHGALDDRLRFAAAIPERLGLALAKALDEEPELAARLRERLRKGAPETAAAELALLTRALRKPPDEKSLNAPSETESTRHAPARGEELQPGIRLQSGAGGAGLLLSGPGVDAVFRARLVQWIKSQSQAPDKD